MLFAPRIGETDDEHVLGEPAFGARLPARNAQRVALLAEQRIAAVSRAEALDGELFRIVHDESTVRIQLTRRVKSAHEFAVPRDTLESTATHASHDGHVEDDIGAVGDLDTAARVRRVDGPH